MEKKLILFDVDGTLYDNHNRCIPDSTIKAIKKLKTLGHEIVVATGRAYFMLYAIEELKPLVDHYILINGQHVIANNKVIYEDTIPNETIKSIIKSMRSLGIIYGFQSTNCEAISILNEDTKSVFNKMHLNYPPEDSKFYEHKKVYQMWCFCNQEQSKIIQKDHPSFNFIKWQTGGFDIIKKGQSKGKGLIKLIDHLGYNIKDVVAFGDGDNDVEMIEIAGIGIAMGNATEDLKQVSDFVTQSVDDDGVFKALKHFNFI